MDVVHVLTSEGFGAQPRAYNRAELVDILGLVGEAEAESQESRPLLLSIVESFVNEVGKAVGGGACLHDVGRSRTGRVVLRERACVICWKLK